MGNLSYLMDEICAGLEIYYTGRTGGHYLKTAFILVDDYTELTSKLFLITDNPGWQDVRNNGHYKNYHDIQQDVQTVVSNKMPLALNQVRGLHAAMASRRSRRNDFFHSTKLLDLSVTLKTCIEAFCDLLDYGGLLFGQDWTNQLCVTRNMETLDVMIRLEKKSFSDPTVISKVNKVLADCPRNGVNPAKKGVHITEYPEDFHVRLSVLYGGTVLRDKLRAI